MNPANLGVGSHESFLPRRTPEPKPSQDLYLWLYVPGGGQESSYLSIVHSRNWHCCYAPIKTSVTTAKSEQNESREVSDGPPRRRRRGSWTMQGVTLQFLALMGCRGGAGQEIPTVLAKAFEECNNCEIESITRKWRTPVEVET